MGKKKRCNNCCFKDLRYNEYPCMDCQNLSMWQKQDEKDITIVFDEFDVIECDKQLRGGK